MKSSSGETIARNNPTTPIRRYAAIVIALLVLASGIVVGRRWVHHAQLELVPVIVPPGINAQSVLTPPASAIAERMRRDIRDLLSAPQRPRLAVLTFDDGPYPVETPALAAELTSLHVPADCFVIGVDVRHQPAIARRLAGAGIELANHTLTHPEMPSLSFLAQRAEIENGARAVRETTGANVRYFRPPHGSYNASTLQAAAAAGEIVALWDVDPGDWRTLSPDAIVSFVTDHARAPAVILLHNGKDATIAALPRIVAAYEHAGFEFVTLSELRARVPLDDINDPVRVQL